MISISTAVVILIIKYAYVSSSIRIKNFYKLVTKNFILSDKVWLGVILLGLVVVRTAYSTKSLAFQGPFMNK